MCGTHTHTILAPNMAPSVYVPNLVQDSPQILLKTRALLRKPKLKSRGSVQGGVSNGGLTAVVKRSSPVGIKQGWLGNPLSKEIYRWGNHLFMVFFSIFSVLLALSWLAVSIVSILVLYITIYHNRTIYIYILMYTRMYIYIYIYYYHYHPCCYPYHYYHYDHHYHYDHYIFVHIHVCIYLSLSPSSWPPHIRGEATWRKAVTHLNTSSSRRSSLGWIDVHYEPLRNIGISRGLIHPRNSRLCLLLYIYIHLHIIYTYYIYILYIHITYIFGYLWARVLSDYQKDVETSFPLDRFPADDGPRLFKRQVATTLPASPFHGVSWMDDLAVAISADSCRSIVDKAMGSTGILLDHCLSHGMQPNLSAGKTELLFALHGAGHRKLRTELFGPTAAQQLDIVGEYHTHQVRVVTRYKHLGGLVHHKGDLRAEIKRRLSLAHAAFSTHRRLLYHNPHLSMQRRVEVFHSLVLSKFLYGTESWIFTDLQTKSALHAGLMRLFRRLLRRGHAAHLTDDDILVATGLPSPSELLRLQRLRYLGTLFSCNHLVEWGVLNQDQAWLALVEDDLRWLWWQLRSTTTFGHPEQHIEAWLEIARYHSTYWKRLIRRGGNHAILQRSREHEVACFHRNTLLQLVMLFLFALDACSADWASRTVLVKELTWIEHMVLRAAFVTFLMVHNAPLAWGNITPRRSSRPTCTTPRLVVSCSWDLTSASPLCRVAVHLRIDNVGIAMIAFCLLFQSMVLNFLADLLDVLKKLIGIFMMLFVFLFWIHRMVSRSWMTWQLFFADRLSVGLVATRLCSSLRRPSLMIQRLFSIWDRTLFWALSPPCRHLHTGLSWWRLWGMQRLNLWTSTNLERALPVYALLMSGRFLDRSANIGSFSMLFLADVDRETFSSFWTRLSLSTDLACSYTLSPWTLLWIEIRAILLTQMCAISGIMVSAKDGWWGSLQDPPVKHGPRPEPYNSKMPRARALGLCVLRMLFGACLLWAFENYTKFASATLCCASPLALWPGSPQSVVAALWSIPRNQQSRTFHPFGSCPSLTGYDRFRVSLTWHSVKASLVWHPWSPPASCASTSRRWCRRLLGTVWPRTCLRGQRLASLALDSGQQAPWRSTHRPWIDFWPNNFSASSVVSLAQMTVQLMRLSWLCAQLWLSPPFSDTIGQDFAGWTSVRI